ncbi:putative mariner transposase [Trichonephila clavipes]|nr:putative mariner transposase [Trichonephila clavipes]
MQLLPLPAYSPDVSPIEHVWDLVGRRLALDPCPAASKRRTFTAHIGKMELSSTSKHSKSFCFKLGYNARETFAKLHQAYGDSVLSSAQVFRCFKAFSEGRESIEEEPRSRTPSVSKTAENVFRVRDLVRSDRRLTVMFGEELNLNHTTVHQILTNELKMRKICAKMNHLKGHHFGTLENIQTAVTDQLKAIPISEFHQCYEEWKKLLQRCVAAEGSYFEADNVEFDETHFWLNGYVNKQNCRIWSKANPQVYVETPLHPEKLTVWCALWAGGIIGPYFFKNDEGHNVTVNDGATCHTARATIDLLKETFGDRPISRFGPVNWPPRSCDLTPLDYFLWGYVISLVYADKQQTLDHLEDNFRRVIADIRPQMLEKVIENWTSRLDYIRANRGSHMPEIIFKM